MHRDLGDRVLEFICHSTADILPMETYLGFAHDLAALANPLDEDELFALRLKE